jgi:carbon storage regulator CsrA
MLVLSRKVEQKIHIGGGITITVLRIRGRAVKIGIEAPDGLEIVRGELVEGAPSPDSPAAPPASGREPAAMPADRDSALPHLRRRSVLGMTRQPWKAVTQPAASPPGSLIVT